MEIFKGIERKSRRSSVVQRETATGCKQFYNKMFEVHPGADPVKTVAGYESCTLRILSESRSFYESGTADNFVS